MKKELVYVSAPYGAPTINEVYENVMKARSLAVELWKLGYLVICPHTNTIMMDGLVPYDTFLELDFRLIDAADVVVFGKNWRNSIGCNKEYEYARSQGKKCLEALFRNLDFLSVMECKGEENENRES